MCYIVIMRLYVLRGENMINIGICDDEQQIVESLREKIEQYAEEYHWDVDFIEFHSGEELLTGQRPIDLLFLDIEMPGMDGIEAGKIFRRSHPDCKIAMVTSMEGRMREAFSLEAFSFVSKPFEQQHIDEVLEEFANRRIGYQKILVYKKRKKFYVEQREIVFIQTFDSYTEFLVGEDIYRSEKSLASLEQELEEKLFVRIDRKHIINLGHLEEYQKGVVSIAGRMIKVARSRRNAFEEKYREYDLRYR